ncbi:MAG: sigma-70 family RNA polymerase sigma factor [Actinobacteria bacterium]|nr:sigma-70 family RNA polymerase sigma factor [Actinomycetota bacterium]
MDTEKVNPSAPAGSDIEFLTTAAEELSPVLYRFARSIVRSPELAEDLVQQTFLKALEHQNQFKGGSLLSWLRRILYNQVIDNARHSKFEMPVNETAMVAEVERHWMDEHYSVDPAIVTERLQVAEELEDALIRLPYLYRAVVVLHDQEGWTLREIAETMGIGIPAAKQRLRRGRMMMVSALASGAERKKDTATVPMSCWDARRLVSDYIDNELDVSKSKLLEAHLEHCSTCPPLYAALVGVRDQLKGNRDPDSVIPPGLRERIRQRLLDSEAGQSKLHSNADH